MAARSEITCYGHFIMKKPIDIQEWKENKYCHITGNAQCVLCQKTWVAVAPAGTVWLECPYCFSNKGSFFINHVSPLS